MKDTKKEIALILAESVFCKLGDTKDARKKMKTYYKENIGRYEDDDPLAKDVRIVYDDNGEEWSEIWKCGECDPTDTNEEIHKWFWDEFATRIYSPWDCTGKPFTTDVSVIRTTPTTFIIINHMALDI